MSVAGLDIDLQSATAPRTIVANFLWYPDIAATADGKPAVVTEDEWHRIVVAAPSDTKQIRVRYAPPRRAGTVMALLLALFGAGATVACQRFRA